MKARNRTIPNVIAALTCALLARAASSQQSSYDFSFVQLGDTRVAPRLTGEPEPKEILGEQLFRGLVAGWKEPQRIAGEDVPRPGFAVCTGNLTEFGAPGETWRDVERLFGTLGMPWYPVAGQCDNAWNPVAVRIASAHPTPTPSGMGPRASPTGFYSFEAFGCHFVVLNCATIQDPHAVIDVEELNWLRADLTLTARGAPVFLCLDQPLDSAEFAQPFQLRMLMDALDGANVALVLHGHGRTGARRVLEGLDCVTCGGTVAPNEGGDRGYNLISVTQDVLRVEYRSLDGTRPPQRLLEKALTPRSQQRRAPHFEFNGTGGFAGHDEEVRVPSGVVQILEGVSTPDEDVAKELTLRIDERPIATDWQSGPLVTEAERNRCRNAGLAPNNTWIGWFHPPALAPGAHLLTVEFASRSGVRRQRTIRFYAPGGPAVVTSRHLEPLGSNRAGVVLGTKGVRTTTAGYMLRMDDPAVDYGGRNKTVAGVLGVPAYDLSGSIPVLVTPAPDGYVCGLRADQDMQQVDWRYATGVPVYGSVLIHEGIAYVGDTAGHMHAIDLSSHAAKWVASTGGCSIEMKPLLAGELLVFGAWDGFVYALHKDDGALAWKQPVRSGAQTAADCTPVSLAGQIFICDAGGSLTSFTPAGEPRAFPFASVAAIAPAANGEHLYLRCSDDHLRKINAEGTIVWDAAVELGSIPVAPVERDGVVVACSDRGLVSWIDAETGRSLGTYQATPGAFVMAPLVLDDEGFCWVGGMDGSLAGLRLWR